MQSIRELYDQQMKDCPRRATAWRSWDTSPATAGTFHARGGGRRIDYATKVEKRNCSPDDICAINLKGEPVYTPQGRKATSEWPFHLRVYQKRPDLPSVVHAHPPILTGYAIAGVDVMATPFLPECAIEVGPMILVPYAQPGSDALAEMFDEPLRRSNAF